MDMIATMTPDEYRTVKAQLQAEGLWNVGGNPVKEAQSARRAEQILKGLR